MSVKKECRILDYISCEYWSKKYRQQQISYKKKEKTNKSHKSSYR